MAESGSSEPVKTALEAIKAAMEVLKIKPDEEKSTRAGPLVVVGRFYVSLTLILAVTTSAASILDWRMFPHHPDFSITVLRLAVLIVIATGLILGAVLLGILVWKNPGFLFSPTELSNEMQQSLIGAKKKEETTVVPNVPQAPPTTPAPTTPSQQKTKATPISKN